MCLSDRVCLGEIWSYPIIFILLVKLVMSEAALAINIYHCGVIKSGGVLKGVSR